MTRVGIIGGAGYTAGELIRLLLNHPGVELVFVHSSSNAGSCLYEVHSGIYGDTQMRFCDTYELGSIDLLFLCGAHGRSREFWKENTAPASLKVIDLAQDYRDESEGYVYGLPELQRERICGADRLANPGCFATAIQLALLPLAGAGLINSDVSITAVTGSTGAGVKPSPTTHFSWRTGNLSYYKVFGHQHLAEIRRSLASLQPGMNAELNFVPVRGDFSRGIFANLHLECGLGYDDALALYRDYYSEALFTHVCDFPIDLKQVVNTNKCLISLEKHGDKLVIFSVIDNLLKGASGQAVQNMNLMCGFAEDTGLRLKASAF